MGRMRFEGAPDGGGRFALERTANAAEGRSSYSSESFDLDAHDLARLAHALDAAKDARPAAVMPPGEAFVRIEADGDGVRLLRGFEGGVRVALRELIALARKLIERAPGFAEAEGTLLQRIFFAPPRRLIVWRRPNDACGWTYFEFPLTRRECLGLAYAALAACESADR
jgi:hypothetical protein